MFGSAHRQIERMRSLSKVIEIIAVDVPRENAESSSRVVHQTGTSVGMKSRFTMSSISRSTDSR
ncbi:MAG: hypothetical protein ACRD1T_18410, partial [Acidimicrobiia bacterium]